MKKSREYIVVKKLSPEWGPVNMEGFYVVEPTGMIIRMVPTLHVDQGGDRNILRGGYNKKTSKHTFNFSEWADEAGYRALDEVYADEDRSADYSQYVKRQDFYRENPNIKPVPPMPDEWLPQLVLDRRGSKTPDQKHFQFPSTKKSKKNKKEVNESA